jgi:hypothetical protein
MHAGRDGWSHDPIALDLDAEHPVELTEVSDLYALAHASLEVIYKARVGGGDRAVINMYCYDCGFIGFLIRLVEYGLVDRTLFEAEGVKNRTEFLIPASFGLLQAVKRLYKAQDLAHLPQALCNQVGAACTEPHQSSTHYSDMLPLCQLGGARGADGLPLQ